MSVHIKATRNMHILLYVDDIIVAGNNKRKIEEIKKTLCARFHMKDLGELTSFLGISIKRKRGEMFLSQQAHLKRLLKRFGMEECNQVNTPMDSTINTGEHTFRRLETLPRTSRLPHVCHVDYAT